MNELRKKRACFETAALSPDECEPELADPPLDDVDADVGERAAPEMRSPCSAGLTATRGGTRLEVDAEKGPTGVSECESCADSVSGSASLSNRGRLACKLICPGGARTIESLGGGDSGSPTEP